MITEKYKIGTIAIYVGVFLASSLLLGTLLRMLAESVGTLASGGWTFQAHLLIEGATWGVGALVTLVLGAVYAINGGFRGVLGGKNGEANRVEGSLENSRFLTEKERDKYFLTFTYETITE